MRAVLGDIQSRPRLFGYDILFETETMWLFCYTSDNDGRRWSLNAEFQGPLQDLTGLLSRFTHRLIDAGYNYSIGYNQIDEDGKEMGEEVSLYHPAFDRIHSSRSASQ